MSDISVKYFSSATFFPSFIITEILHDWKVTPKSVAGEQNKTLINMDI